MVREVVDTLNIFECSKGHKWEETPENRFVGLPLPINFPMPNGDNLCPFCLDELFSNIGRVIVVGEVIGRE